MGHKEIMTKGQLYLDGEPLGSVTAGIPICEVTYPANATFPKTFGFNRSMTFSVRMKTPKCYRCHSRKRFIKLLMQQGASRNMAARIASLVRAANGRISYQSAYVKIALMLFFGNKEEAQNGTA